MSAAGLDVVAFDLMDTLIHDPYIEALEAATQMSLAQLYRLRDASAYPDLECGRISEAAYWDRFRTAGIPVDPAAFHRVRQAGYRWLDGMEDLLAEVRGCVRTVVASNYPDWIDDLASGLLAGKVDGVYASVRFGVRKPDPGFYAALAGQLGVAPQRVGFIDDRAANVEGAAAAGMRAWLATSAEELRAALSSAGVLDAQQPR